MLEKLNHARAAIKLALTGNVKLGAKLREGFKFTERRKIKSQRARDFFHGFNLRVTTHAAHGNTHVNRGTNTGREQFRLQVNLTVGDGNYVGRNVSRHVAFLRFNNWKRGKRAAAILLGEFGGSLKQTTMQIEHVAGIGFAAWRTAQQKRKFAVRNGLL